MVALFCYTSGMDTKLIILRGPSGAGKSTIAKKLRESSSRKIATVEQDMFRHSILHDQDGARELSATMMKDAILSALGNGYDVIADGIFNLTYSKKMLDEIFENHKNNNFIYFFNISFDETVRRHAQRDKKNDFGAEEMRKWYTSASTSGYDFEKEITEDMSEDDVLREILKNVEYV